MTRVFKIIAIAALAVVFGRWAPDIAGCETVRATAPPAPHFSSRPGQLPPGAWLTAQAPETQPSEKTTGEQNAEAGEPQRPEDGKETPPLSEKLSPFSPSEQIEPDQAVDFPNDI
jgi:hypothetical protein